MEPIAKLVELFQLLTNCKYEFFWTIWNRDEICQDVTGGVVGFESAIRNGNCLVFS